MREIDKIKEVARKRLAPVDKLRNDNLGHPDMWPVYNMNAWEYLEDSPLIKKLVKEYFSTHAGEEINHLDIAGNARFNLDKPITFANFAFERKKKDRDPDIIEGDIMEDADFEKLIDKIKTDKNLLDIVTFQPIGGLGEYTPKELSAKENLGSVDPHVEYSQQQIEFRLLKIFIRRIQSVADVMKTGGLLYLGESYLLRDYFMYESPMFKTLFKKLGFETVVEPNKNSPTFLLRKI